MVRLQPDTADTTSLQVSELFYSIQGESTYAGYPCAFIRLAGCNLRCSYCDARYTYEEPSSPLSIAELISFTEKHPAALVQITGGEPLLQPDVFPLMEKLVQARRLVLLETNGSISLKDVPGDVVKIMDIKCPGSLMSEKMHLANLKLLSPADELKFVISSREDYDWAVGILHDHIADINNPAHIRNRVKVLFSPVTTKLNPPELAQWIMEDGLLVRLQLQLHISLWPSKTRGF